MKVVLAMMLLAAASAAHAQPLTVRAGESWAFTIRSGQPAAAHKVSSSAKPAKGEVMVTVRALFGTMLIGANNSGTNYKFSAELLLAKTMTAVRTCILPAGGKPTLEQWEQKAAAVRISNFRATGNEGIC